jgi:hypothetical protein
VKAYQQFFIENGPPGPYRRIILLEFIQRAIADASDYFTKTLQNEIYLQNTISSDTVVKLEERVNELKEEVRKSKDGFDSKIKTLETEKAELSAKE